MDIFCFCESSSPENSTENNTNLGAKGVIALEAFSRLCAIVHSASEPSVNESTTELGDVGNCTVFSTLAHRYARTWLEHAFTPVPQPHYKLSYNNLSLSDADSWSIKYNLAWQRVLGAQLVDLLGNSAVDFLGHVLQS